MEYELLKQFDELLSKYYQLLQEPNDKNIDAIIKSIEEEKIHIEKSMQDFKKSDDKVNALLNEKQNKEVASSWYGFYVNKLGKLMFVLLKNNAIYIVLFMYLRIRLFFNE